MHTHTYSIIEDYDSPYVRCRELVARCAPKFMRIGGGALTQEAKRTLIHTATLQQQLEVDRMLRDGIFRPAEIGRMCGVTLNYVCKRKYRMQPSAS